MKNDADSICQIHYHSYHALAYFDVGSLSQLQVCSSLEGKKGVLLKKEKKKKEGEGEAEKKKKSMIYFGSSCAERNQIETGCLFRTSPADPGDAQNSRN